MAKRKPRGRKPGSKNRDYEPAAAIAAVCMKCGSTKIRAVPGATPIVRNIAGVLRDGTEYSAVKWQRSVCECGQYLNVRTHIPPAPTADS